MCIQIIQLKEKTNIACLGFGMCGLTAVSGMPD